MSEAVGAKAACAHTNGQIATPSPRQKKRTRRPADVDADQADTKPKQPKEGVVGKLIKHEDADGDASMNGCASHAKHRHADAGINGQASPVGHEKGEVLAEDSPAGLACASHASEAVKQGGKQEQAGEGGEAGAANVSGESSAEHAVARAELTRKGVAMFTGKEGPADEMLEDSLVVAVGAKCMAYDAFDFENEPPRYKSSIVALEGNKAKIHYDGWGARFDTWVDKASLKPPVKKTSTQKLPTPSISTSDPSAKAVHVKLTMPAEAPKVHELVVLLDDMEDKVKVKSFKFDPAANSYMFEYRGLMPCTRYEIAVKVAARGWLVSEFSQRVDFKTAGPPEERSVVVEAGTARSAKALADRKSKQQAGLLKKDVKVELSEEELRSREEKRRTKNHDMHCDLCLGWATDGPLICCDGVCKRSFHLACVNLDDADVGPDEKWVCDSCQVGRLRCFLCHEPCSADAALSCSRETCKKAFHPKCYAAYAKMPLPEAQEMLAQPNKFICPRHQCAGCGKGQSEYSGVQGKMIRCIRCPLSYHFKCIPSHGYVEYPDPVPSIICHKHPQEVAKFQHLRVTQALRENKIADFDAAAVADPVIKQCMESWRLRYPEPFRVPASYAETRNYQGKKPEPFKLLRSNLYTMGKPKMTKMDITACQCAAKNKSVSTCVPVSQLEGVAKNGGGTCGDDCENRQTMFECLSSVCHADCQNQRLQKRHYPRLELFKTSDGRGWGLRALEDIPKGALVQEYIGEVLTSEAFADRTKVYGPNKPVYFFNINSEMVIDASAMGSMARFINHSCGPNCHTEKWSVGAETRIAIVASDAIPKGTEVTYNYEFESFGAQQHKCMCGAPNCSGFLGKRPKTAKDLEREEKERLSKKKRKTAAMIQKEAQEAEAVAAHLAAERAEQLKRDREEALVGSYVVLDQSDANASQGAASKEGKEVLSRKAHEAMLVLTTRHEHALLLSSDELLEWRPLPQLMSAQAPCIDEARGVGGSRGACVESSTKAGVKGKVEGKGKVVMSSPSLLEAGSPERKKQVHKTFLITRLTSDKIEQLEGDAGKHANLLKISPAGALVTPSYLSQICEALLVHPSISAIDLDNCAIGDEGCPLVEKLVTGNKKLLSVSLQYCDISDRGLQQVLRAFDVSCPSVGELKLNENNITAASAGALEEVQKRYPALLLSLKGNKLLTKENLEKITRWHVHNASDLHSAALRLHQQRIEQEAEQERLKKEAQGEEVPPSVDAGGGAPPNTMDTTPACCVTCPADA